MINEPVPLMAALTLEAVCDRVTLRLESVRSLLLSAARLMIVCALPLSSVALMTMPSPLSMSSGGLAAKLPAKVRVVEHQETSMFVQVMTTGSEEPSPSRSSPTMKGLVKPDQDD